MTGKLSLMERAYNDRDAAQARITALTAQEPKPTKAQQKIRKQARDDDRLLNDYQRRIAQLAALATILTIANEADHDMLACEDGARVLSIAMDLAQQCRDEYDGRLSELVAMGIKAESGQS